MFKDVLKSGFKDITLQDSLTVYLLAKAQADDEVCELALVINRLLKENVSEEIYEKLSDKAKKLADVVIKNKSRLTCVYTEDYFKWLRTFRNDSIKYVICARTLADLQLYRDTMKKEDLFNLVSALNMDRRHFIYDHLCTEVERCYNGVPLYYFLRDKDIEDVRDSYSIDKAMNKQKEVNKVHCGIIRVFDSLKSNYDENFSDDMKELFDRFNDVKVSAEYDEKNVEVILTMFYLLEEYFMFKWEYIRGQGLEGFVEKYICFDK